MAFPQTTLLAVGSLTFPSPHPVPLVLTQYLPSAYQYFEVLGVCCYLVSPCAYSVLSNIHPLRPLSYRLVSI